MMRTDLTRSGCRKHSQHTILVIRGPLGERVHAVLLTVSPIISSMVHIVVCAALILCVRVS